MFIEDLEKLENVINVLFKKKDLPFICNEVQRSRINLEIDNFASICRDYNFNDPNDLLPVRPFDEYSCEDLFSALISTVNLSGKLFEREDLSLTDKGEVGLFIDFVNDAFALKEISS